MKKILLVAMACAGMQVAYSQPWIGSDDLSQPVNTNRWTAYNESLLRTTATGLTKNSTVTHGEVDAGLNFNFTLPTNQTWQITLRTAITSAVTPPSGGLLEAFVGVSSTAGWTGTNSSYYAASHQINQFGGSTNLEIVPNWSLNQGPSGPTTINPTTISSRDTLLRLSYDGSRYLSSSYALPANPSNFTLVDTHDTLAWVDLSEFHLAIGLYSYDSSFSTNDVTIESVSIVPEPSSLSLVVLGLVTLLRFPGSGRGRKASA